MLDRSPKLPTTLVLVLFALSLSACSTLSGRQRAATSSSGCVHAVVRDVLPAGLPDKQAHCTASGLIAFHCSVAEASLAGTSKELKDVFGRGNAEWADMQANRKGIACARKAAEEAQIYTCCQ